MRALVCFCAIAVAGCAAVPAVPMSAAAEAREVLAPAGRLRAGVHQGNGRELARELAGQLRVPLEEVSFAGNAGIIEALRAGRIDVGFAGAAPDHAGIVFVPTGKGSAAIAIFEARRRAEPFLREFVDVRAPSRN